ncbi:hypothetical protein MSPP1_002876 [Malassezia sp. CBS 17886]|nr:hypothetical protein MSPP1_002876 [Malassezia sp. CBS 17886]
MSVVTLEEFLELLNEEQHLDLSKLRNYARHGVQPQVRGEVWLYLLGVLSSDKSQEMTSVRNKFFEYEGVSKRVPVIEKHVRNEVLRYYRQRLSMRPGSLNWVGQSIIRGRRQGRRVSLLDSSADGQSDAGTSTQEAQFPRLLPSTQYGVAVLNENWMSDDSDVVAEERRLAHVVENVLCAYLSCRLAHSSVDQGATDTPTTDAEIDTLESRLPRAYQWAPQKALVQGTTMGDFHPSLVYLCAPFAQCVRAEAGIYFAFERLMTMIEEYNAVHPLPQRVASFVTLFRTTLPELHAYFEAEQVDIVAVATSWLQHLLALEMQMDDLMRLWDTYFAVPNLLDLHLYVCIAILTNCKDALEDLDRSETTSMLFALPPLDVDRIISDAMNIRLSHEHDQMYE